ncbi:MAG: glycosyltransferase [Clostridiales bacterium]|nr:glycosyltransferase [Clostridiales bacterium]
MHESVQKSVLDLTKFLIGAGARVRAAYDPDTLRAGPDGDPWILAMRRYGALTYPLRAKSMPLLRAALTLREMCRSMDIDVVHTHAAGEFCVASLARLFGGGFVHVNTVHAQSAWSAPDILYETAYEAAYAAAQAAGGAGAAYLARRAGMAGRASRANRANRANQPDWASRAGQADWADGGAPGSGGGAAADGDSAVGDGAAGGRAMGDGSAAFGSEAASGSAAFGSAATDGDSAAAGDAASGSGSGAAPESGAGAAAEEPKPPSPGLMRGRRLLSAIAYRALSVACDEIIANSDSAAEELSRRLVRASKISLARVGVSLGARLPDMGAAGRGGSAPGRPFTIAMIVDSDADRFKNWLASDLFVELAARIGKECARIMPEHPGCRFHVLNGRELTDNQYMEIMEKVSGMGLAGRVAVESYSLAGRTSCLERASLCLYHSEGRHFPYPVIEAMSLGIPALTDDRELAGRMASEMGEFGCLADFENPGELVALILALMRDGGLRERAGRMSQAAAKRMHSFDSMASGIYNIYIRGLRI